MINFLTTVLTCIICCLLVLFGATETIDNSDFGGIVVDITEAWASEPDKRPTEDIGGTTQKPDTPVTPGESEGESGTEIIGNDALDAFSKLYDSYDPDLVDINKQVLSNMITSSIPDDNGSKNAAESIINNYVDSLYGAMDDLYNSSEGATEEEKEQAKQEFVERESAAYTGLMEAVDQATNGEADANQTMLNAADDILSSEIITGTIETSRDSINNETKEQLKNAINGAHDLNSADETLTEEEKQQKSEQLDELAKLFGIDLNGSYLPEAGEGE